MQRMERPLFIKIDEAPICYDLCTYIRIPFRQAQSRASSSLSLAPASVIKRANETGGSKRDSKGEERDKEREIK